MASKFFKDNKIAIAAGLGAVVTTFFVLGVKHDATVAKMHNDKMKADKKAAEDLAAAEKKRAEELAAFQTKMRAMFPSYVADWEAEFDKLDADKNGSLKGDELKQLAKYLHSNFHPHSKQSMNEDKFIGGFMKVADKNSDGSISKKEFEEYYMTITKRLQKQLDKKNARIAATKKQHKFYEVWKKMVLGKTITLGVEKVTDKDGVVTSKTKTSGKAKDQIANLDDIKKVIEDLAALGVVSDNMMNLFDTFDEDGDGHVTHTEFINCCMHFCDE
jgi:Ca2+-binding EF-hand superfamily protein